MYVFEAEIYDCSLETLNVSGAVNNSELRKGPRKGSGTQE